MKWNEGIERRVGITVARDLAIELHVFNAIYIQSLPSILVYRHPLWAIVWVCLSKLASSLVQLQKVGFRVSTTRKPWQSLIREGSKTYLSCSEVDWCLALCRIWNNFLEFLYIGCDQQVPRDSGAVILDIPDSRIHICLASTRQVCIATIAGCCYRGRSSVCETLRGSACWRLQFWKETKHQYQVVDSNTRQPLCPQCKWLLTRSSHIL